MKNQFREIILIARILEGQDLIAYVSHNRTGGGKSGHYLNSRYQFFRLLRQLKTADRIKFYYSPINNKNEPVLHTMYLGNKCRND